jgi:hypothetical protein
MERPLLLLQAHVHLEPCYVRVVAFILLGEFTQSSGTTHAAAGKQMTAVGMASLP